MRLSKRTEYGLRAVVQLARLAPRSFVQSKDLVQQEDLPNKFLESILLALRRRRVPGFGELRLVKALTDEQIEIMRDPKRAPTAKLPRIEDAVKAGGFLTGKPADVIDSLKKLEERYPGLDRVTVSLSVGVPLSEALEQLEWFARDVMPAFKGVKVAAPAMAN